MVDDRLESMFSSLIINEDLRMKDIAWADSCLIEEDIGSPSRTYPLESVDIEMLPSNEETTQPMETTENAPVNFGNGVLVPTLSDSHSGVDFEFLKFLGSIPEEESRLSIWNFESLFGLDENALEENFVSNFDDFGVGNGGLENQSLDNLVSRVAMLSMKRNCQ